MRTSTLAVLLTSVILMAGCSGDGGPAAPPVPDTAPPAPPTGLVASGGAGVHKLGWNPNTADPDLLGYHVYQVMGDRAIPLTGSPLAEPQYIVRSPYRGNCRYAVTALDTHGNESAQASVVHLAGREDPGRQD